MLVVEEDSVAASNGVLFPVCALVRVARTGVDLVDHCPAGLGRRRIATPPKRDCPVFREIIRGVARNRDVVVGPIVDHGPARRRVGPGGRAVDRAVTSSDYVV